MANLWDKVKQAVEEGAKTIKESAETVAKNVSEKAPGIASTLVGKGKELADTIGDKAQEMVAVGQLKLKHYNLNREMTEHLAEIGGKVYELIKNNDPNISANVEIQQKVEVVKKLEADIDELEKKIEAAKAPKEAKPETAPEKTKQV